MNLRELCRDPYQFWCECPFDLWCMLWVAWTLMPFSDTTLVLLSYHSFINLSNSFSKDEWLFTFSGEINRRFANYSQWKHHQPTYQLSSVFPKIVYSWVQFVFKGHHFRQFQMDFYGHYWHCPALTVVIAFTFFLCCYSWLGKYCWKCQLRITEWIRLKGMLGHSLIHSPVQSKISYSRSLSAAFKSGFQYVQGYRTHNFFGQSVPELNYPYSEKFFSYV